MAEALGAWDVKGKQFEFGRKSTSYSANVIEVVLIVVARTVHC